MFSLKVNHEKPKFDSSTMVLRLYGNSLYLYTHFPMNLKPEETINFKKANHFEHAIVIMRHLSPPPLAAEAGK